MKLFEKILVGIVLLFFAVQFFPFTGSAALFGLVIWLLTISYAIGGYKMFKPNDRITLVFSVIAGISFAVSLVVIPYSIRLRQELILKILPVFNIMFFIITALYIFLNKKSIPGLFQHLKLLLIRSAVILAVTSFFSYCPVSFGPYRKIMIALNQDNFYLKSNLEMFDHLETFEKALKNKDCDQAIEYIEKARQAGENWLGIVRLGDGTISKEDSSMLWQIGGVYTKMYEAYRCKADFLYNKGQYKEALAIYMKADPFLYVDTMQVQYWEIEKSYSTNSIALCHKFLANYEVADSLFLIAINQYKAVRDTNDIKLCILLSNLADSYSSQEYYIDANNIYKNVINILLKDTADADNKTKLLSSYIDLAKNYIRTDSLPIAMAYLSKVREVSGKDDPNYCTGNIYYGACLYSLSEFLTADSVLKGCLECYRRHFEPTHANFDAAYLMLAKTNLALAHYQVAENYINKGMDIAIKNNGKESLDYALYLKLLGALYIETGNYVEAEKLLLNSLKLTNVFLGATNKKQPEILSELAYVNLILGNFDKARIYSDSSLAINSLFFDQNSSGNTFLYNKAAYVDYCINQYKTSEAFYRKTIRINDEHEMKKSAPTAIALNGLGLIMTERKEFIKADSLFDRSLALHKYIFEDNHPSTAIVYLNYGILKIKEKKLDEATKMLHHSEQINKEFYDNGHDVFADINVGLGDIAVLDHQKDLARNYYQLAQSIYNDKFGKEYYKLSQLEVKLKQVK